MAPAVESNVAVKLQLCKVRKRVLTPKFLVAQEEQVAMPFTGKLKP